MNPLLDDEEVDSDGGDVKGNYITYIWIGIFGANLFIALNATVPVRSLKLGNVVCG